MHVFVPALEVGDTEGFTLEKDIFGRASLGLGMTNLLSSISDPVVLALDGQWGSGKTTFLKIWAGELRKAGFPVVYLDAFRNDYEDDPFMAVAGEIIALADAQRKADTAAAKVFIRKAIGAGKVILRSGLKLGVKAATLGALDTADLEGVASDWAKEASELEDKYLGELLTKHGEQKKGDPSISGCAGGPSWVAIPQHTGGLGLQASRYYHRRARSLSSGFCSTSVGTNKTLLFGAESARRTRSASRTTRQLGQSRLWR